MNVIEGVSVISIGEAKGHGLFVDEQTLIEVKECAEQYKGGVKVNLDHGAGIKDIVGFVNNFRIVGSQLLGDLNLLSTSPMKEYILEISEKLPDAFGISISFSGPTREEGGMRFASCSELYSADLVQTPAANETGLFSAFHFTEKPVDKNHIEMEEEPTADESEKETGETEITIMELANRLSALEASLAEFKTKMEAGYDHKEKEDMCDCSSNKGISKLEAKLDTIISNFGASPIKASVVAVEKTEEKFDLKKLILDKSAELGSRTEAIRFAMRNHRDAYLTARDNNELNF